MGDVVLRRSRNMEENIYPSENSALYRETVFLFQLINKQGIEGDRPEVNVVQLEVHARIQMKSYQKEFTRLR